MKKLALACIAALAFAAPAAAQSTTDIAILHFNMDADSPSDLRMSSGEVLMVDSTDTAALQEALDNFNMSADRLSDTRGSGGVTVIMSDPKFAGEIFRRIMAESAENE